MPASQQIKDLVERFSTHRDSYKNSAYNETQLRREFLDPFFKALGWDIDNEQGLAEAYKDVIHEDAIKVGAFTKAPDYCFRIGGQRKFFVEAKKPSINLKDDISPAFQLRRYGWSAKLPISILSDFEEFVVYDNRLKPVKSDKASKGRLLYIRFDEYVDRWDEIASIFSKDAILKGSFDAFAEKSKIKKGADEVDKAFLKEIEKWREDLAKDIATNNPSLDTWQINFAVQKTIDRIIFLRIAEDRGIEQYGRLMALQNGTRIYPRLVELFERADEKYNSGLFHFKPEKSIVEPADELTQKIKISDDTLKTIFKNLYYPESPYEFSVLPADILGQVYEQFLGKVIRLTASHRALIEEKPEVRKAGGVYYTPTYIVDYIVKHTVGKLLENKTPKQISKIRILDPACGSGSFLLGAYQYLLDWHRDYYTKENPVELARGKNPLLYQTHNGEWRLTTAEKRRILLNNIYGVDIDSQAVEVTKLSLSLKVLEGENEETLNRQLRLFHERALPDLGNNIKCGNSLIGPDFFTTQLMPDPAELRRINPFDWHQEFRDIMSVGGFDVVIGNPPWGAEFTVDEREFLIKKHSVVSKKTKDSYLFFVIKSLAILNKKGHLGIIIPNTWLLINNADKIRKLLLKLDIKEIIDYGDGVFKDATVESSILLLQNDNGTTSSCRSIRYKKGEIVIDHLVDKANWLQDDLARIIIGLDSRSLKVLNKIKISSESFENNCVIIWGIKPYQEGYGVPPQTREMIEKRIYHSDTKAGTEWKPLVVGSDVDRYSLNYPGKRYIKYGKWLMYPSNENLMKGPKIFLRQTSDKIRASYDESGHYCQNSVFIVHSDKINLFYLLGILNSKVMDFIYRLNNPQTKKVFAEVKPSVIKKLPIHVIDFSNSHEKDTHDLIVKLVKHMLELDRRYNSVSDTDQQIIQRQITATDQKIDQLVNKIYDLTEEEIKVVEGN